MKSKVNTSESELSCTYAEDPPKSSVSDIIEASIMSANSTKVEPSNFASLQQCLKRNGMEYSSIDTTNLFVKDALEKSLVDFISIDTLSEKDKFYCDTCAEKASGKI